jgi:hypothetical protein
LRHLPPHASEVEYGAEDRVVVLTQQEVSNMISLDRQTTGDLQKTIALVDTLRRDLQIIAAGRLPPALAHAPVLDQVILGKRVLPCLVGHVGQATDHGGVIKTSELWAVNWDAGWVRTLDSFYRLNRALDLKTR